MTLGVGLPGSPRLLLLLLLSSHSLYYLPDQVPCLPLHPDGVGLVRVVEFEHVLNTSDLAQGTCKHLCRTLLLLALLLIALRHLVLLTTLVCSIRKNSTLYRQLHVYTPFTSKSDTGLPQRFAGQVYLRRKRGTTGV